MDRRALANCDSAIYPTEWAAQAAVDVYGADPAKVHVVPFGANVDAPPIEALGERIARRAGGDRLRLLFVGRDWHRKGADIVLDACDGLRRAGIDLELELVGLARGERPLPDYVTSHGLLDKNIPEQKARMHALYLSSDIFFVPSRAENYGMAFCEAAAYGLPVISMAIGGIPTIVKNGITGRLHDSTSRPEDYAASITELLDDLGMYHRMSAAARDRFDQVLNWDAFGDRLAGILSGTAPAGSGVWTSAVATGSGLHAAV